MFSWYLVGLWLVGLEFEELVVFLHGKFMCTLRSEALRVEGYGEAYALVSKRILGLSFNGWDWVVIPK